MRYLVGSGSPQRVSTSTRDTRLRTRFISNDTRHSKKFLRPAIVMSSDNNQHQFQHKFRINAPKPYAERMSETRGILRAFVTEKLRTSSARPFGIYGTFLTEYDRRDHRSAGRQDEMGAGGVHARRR